MKTVTFNSVISNQGFLSNLLKPVILNTTVTLVNLKTKRS